MANGTRQPVLVTGAGGFLGRHLCPLLAERREVIGIDLPGVAATIDGPWHTAPEPAQVGALLDEAKPGIVVHAAFRNRKPGDWPRTRYFAEVLADNLPLFEACAERGIGILLCSSSAVYGASRDNRPLHETDPVAPVSTYGAAKALQEMLLEVFADRSLRTCTARLFNLIGPGQAPGMLLPDWLHGVATIAAGGEPVLRVHNRATWRDFVDVRDAARALREMVDDFRPGEVVNVASGEPVSLMDLSDFLEELSPVPFEVVELRPAIGADDVPRQCGNNSRARELWGWEPSIGWRESVTDAWREIGEQEPASSLSER